MTIREHHPVHEFVGSATLCEACGTTLNAPVHSVPWPIEGPATFADSNVGKALAELIALDALEVRGRCLVCGDVWTERADEAIVVCPECGSLEVEED